MGLFLSLSLPHPLLINSPGLPSIYSLHNSPRNPCHSSSVLEYRPVHLSSDNLQASAGHTLHPRSYTAVLDSPVVADVLGISIVSTSCLP